MDYFIIYNSAVLEKDGKKMTLVCKDGTRKPFDNIWDFSTETFPTTEEYAKQFLSKKNEIVRSHFIVRDCGTGAGGFKAGNACAKGGDGDGEGDGEEGDSLDFDNVYLSKDEKFYKDQEEKWRVPAALLREGVLDSVDFMDGEYATVFVNGEIAQRDSDVETALAESLTGDETQPEETEVVYKYGINGKNDEPYKLDVAIAVETYFDGSVGETTKANIGFRVNDSFNVHKDDNLAGEGLKIVSLVEDSVTHFVKENPQIRNFEFSGRGYGRNGLARLLLYRRLATKIAKKIGGMVKEKIKKEELGTGYLPYTETTWSISPAAARSLRMESKDKIITFTYSYQHDLVDPEEDKAEQKFWGLDETNEERDCGTGAGGFKAGNACANGGDGGSVEVEEKISEDTANLPLNPTKKDQRDWRNDMEKKYKSDSCPAAYHCDEEFNTELNYDTLPTEVQTLLAAYGGDAYDEISNGGRALKETDDFSQTSLDALEVCCLGKTSNEVVGDMQEMIKANMSEYFPDFDSDSDISMYENEIENKAEELAKITFNEAAQEAHDMMNKELQNLEIDTKGRSVYRGFKLSEKTIDSFVDGLRDGVFETQTVQSWTKNSDLALEFANVGSSAQIPVLFIAKGVVRGVDLNQSGQATQTQESEVTLPSNNYKVKKITLHKNSDKKIIGLEVEVDQSE